MQINNQVILDSFKITDYPSNQIKQGTVSPLLIKERLGSNETIAVIKGQEVRVQFEGTMPAKDSVFIEIGTVNEKGILLVKAISNQPVAKTNVTESLDSMILKVGLDPAKNGDLRETAKMVASKGAVVNEETLTNLQYFLNSESGTLDQKLATINRLLQKKLELSIPQLSAVHQLLHGKSISDSLIDLIDSLGLENDFTVDHDLVSINDNHIKAVHHALEGKGDFQGDVEKWVSVTEQNSAKIVRGNEFTNVPPQKMTMSEGENYTASESVESQNFHSKNVIVTKITEKFSGLASDFKKNRQEVLGNLDGISKLMTLKQSAATIKQSLENTIHKLDQIILKSDFMLYADMETEKKMLAASSKLAEAKELIGKGNYSDASTIVKEIKSSLEGIQFKPSDVRMKHFVKEQGLLQTETSLNKIVSQKIEQTIKAFPGQESSGRHVLETIKGLGLTHEIEAASSLLKPKGEPQQEQKANLKTALMRLLQNEDGQTRAAQAIDQTLTHLTGQQLLNKHDASGLQQLYLQLPLLLNKEIENIKVYVNSEKKGEKLDWENCSLYFVLESKKMGEVGIMVNSQNRRLSLTFKNNHDLFQEKMEPLAEETLDHLQEIGYMTGPIQFNTFTKETVEIEERPKIERKRITNSAVTRKGFDLSI